MNLIKLIKKIINKDSSEKTIDYNAKYANRYIKLNQQASDLILAELEKNTPCLITRFGSIELSAFERFMRYKPFKVTFKESIKNGMYMNAGFFPSIDEYLNRFCEELIPIIKNIDIMGVWFLKGEEKALKKYAPKAKLVALSYICPIYCDNPWTKYLKNKKVLIIHPFEDSIKKQYEKRELLFKNKDTLPEFELITLKAVQSIADNKDDLPYKNWFEALEHMKSQISQIDFDIAIIGAGAYGMFLADYCKRLNKQAIHMGGATQTLFGIIGRRWEVENVNFKDEFINEHWVYPLETEKPKGFKKIESGCYW